VGVHVDLATSRIIFADVVGAVRSLPLPRLNALPAEVGCPHGCIRTIAGTQQQSAAGDGGLAMDAYVAMPLDITVLPTGDLFMTEARTGNVRRVYSNNASIDTILTMYTYRPSGGQPVQARMQAPSGLAQDMYNSNIYIADYTTHCVYILSAASGYSDAAAYAGLCDGVDHRADPGAPFDGLAATSAALFHPNDTAVDPTGLLLIADGGNDRIRIVNSDGTMSTFAGGGAETGDGILASNALLSSPSSIAIDNWGNVYFTSKVGYLIVIYKVDVSNGSMWSVTMSDANNCGPSIKLEDNIPAATTCLLAVDGPLYIDADGNLYFAYTGMVLEIFASNASVSVIAGKRPGNTGSAIGGSGDGFQPTLTLLSAPFAVTMDSRGVLFISELGTASGHIRAIVEGDAGTCAHACPCICI
jgi:hypothetical protein